MGSDCISSGSLLIFLIHLLRKTSKVRLPLPVVNLDKASVCGDQETSFSFWQKRKIGIHIYREFRSVWRDSYLGAQYRQVPTISGLITCMVYMLTCVTCT